MSIWKAGIWFVVGLVGTMALQVLFKNEFIVAFVVAAVLGVLGAKD